MTESSEEAEETRTIDFGCSTPTIIVDKSSTLNDVREAIESNWTLKQLRVVTGVDRLPIAFSKDGEQIPFEQEWEEIVGLHQWKIEEPKSSPDPCDELEPSDAFGDLLLGMIGWNPPAWYKFKKEKECGWALFEAAFFVTFFFLDIVDTVVDLVTSSQAIIERTEETGGSDPYAILLFVMTILARFLTGWYGVAYKQAITSGPMTEIETYFGIETLIWVYFWVELCVFMMEDGAAVLYLVNNPNEKSIWDEMNLYLTMTCGGGMILCLFVRTCLFLHNPTYFGVNKMQGYSLWDCSYLNYKMMMLLLGTYNLGTAISMIILLATQVLPDEVQDPIAGNKTSQIRWVIVYAVGTFICALTSFYLISFIQFKNFNRIVHTVFY